MSTILRCTRALALGSLLVGIAGGTAGAQEPPNGDFEDGVLDPWIGSGDVGVTQDNVLEGAFSGFLTTGVDDEEDGVDAVGGVCSTLESAFVFPPTDRARAEVAFKVRYKTQEGVGPFSFYEDPFHAELRTAKGTVDLLTIKTDGIFWTKGDPTNTDVKGLRHPPQIPPFEPDSVLEGVAYAFETPPLPVRSRIKLKGCEPVSIKFQICDWFDTVVDSAAVVDDVKIKFREDGDKCVVDMIDNSIMEQVEEFPPAPRE